MPFASVQLPLQSTPSFELLVPVFAFVASVLGAPANVPSALRVTPPLDAALAL